MLFITLATTGKRNAIFSLLFVLIVHNLEEKPICVVRDKRGVWVWFGEMRDKSMSATTKCLQEMQ